MNASDLVKAAGAILEDDITTLAAEIVVLAEVIVALAEADVDELPDEA